MASVIVLMGVAGSGKSSVGLRLSEILGWPFFDGDDFHPVENIAKMSQGTPLDDNDRKAWLVSLHDLIAQHLGEEKSILLACSALKQKYRDQLREHNPEVIFVYLNGGYELVFDRLQIRKNHYMMEGMLQSQYDDLEEPINAIEIDIHQNLDSIVEQILQNLDLIYTGAKMELKADIGLIGLAVMGQNLVLNMADHGYTVAVFNRTTSKVDDFVNGNALGTGVIGTHSIEQLVEVLKSPRRVMLMVKAGQPVDQFIEMLIPHLEPGDIIIDGGNSNFHDSVRRASYVETKGLYFIGTGVSGGEEGARHGPSIMPGGSADAWPSIKDIFQNISAKVEDGSACCDWVGADGAGHFVKMVHNGIEYGDMQLISEAYHLMKSVLGMNAGEMHEVFAGWNHGKLESYLIEITADILAFRDQQGEPVLEVILDAAGQKGTGRWTAITALDLGVPLSMIGEAVLARSLSSLKDERIAASKTLSGPEPKLSRDKYAFIEDIHQALYAAKIISYTQGYMLMRAAAGEFNWDLNYGSIALMWRGGCIIRSIFLGKIKEAYDKDPKLSNLLLDPYFKVEVEDAQAAWRRVVAGAVENGIPIPAMSSALAFYDGYRTERLPANLLQAQRDYFGAHRYERVDRARGEFFHTDWISMGGSVASSTYNA
jgi:6-phosphogluconate dehydrogenase